MSIPQGPDADLAYVERVLSHQIQSALGDILDAARNSDIGEFFREFTVAGAKWCIKHVPVRNDGVCTGYEIRLMQNWKAGHIPAHFELVQKLLVAEEYQDIRTKLNVITASYSFPS